MKKSLALTLTCGLLLAACTAPKAGSDAVPKARADGYEDLKSGVVGNGEKSVLFFHAAWCPNCKEKDENLLEWYGSSDIPVKTYKVDFDTEEGLKRKYNVSMQDTFVLIDGTGKAIKTEIAPSLSQLKRLLYLNIDEAKAMDVENGKRKMENGKQKMEMDAEESEEAKDVGDTMKKKEPAAAMEENVPKKNMMASAGAYTAYTEGVIGNGKASVLFFHAAWCPACKANNAKLLDWYGSNNFSRSVYKIDFDTATDLRAKYGVTGQDTFILIDGSGKEVERVSFPSESALRELLG